MRPSSSASTRTAPTTTRARPDTASADAGGGRDSNANASQHGDRGVARLWERPAVSPDGVVTEIWVPQGFYDVWATFGFGLTLELPPPVPGE